MHRIFPFIIIAGVLFASCGNKKKSTKPGKKGASDWYLGLEKTPCFGECEVYRMDLNKNGELRLDARRFMDRSGTYTGTLSQQNLENLKRLLVIARWKEYDEQYMTGYSDLPSTIVYFSDTVGDTTMVQFENDKAPREVLGIAKALEDVKIDTDWSKTYR